ncbi:MAG: ATP-binding cassette domain-containing protein [Gammaproteobacteria bacterium]
MLSIDALDVTIGAVPILSGVSMQLPAGLISGLIGRNGAGKTTLLRALMGAIPAQHGAVRFQGHNLLALRDSARAALGIGYMPEDRKLVPEFSAEENMLLPAWAIGMVDARDRLAWIYDLMPEVKTFRQQRANQLSGGQQKLVALGRALMCGSRLLLLDEPFEGLAPALARRLAQVLYDLKQQQISALIADSNQQHMADLLDKIFMIERGKVQG